MFNINSLTTVYLKKIIKLNHSNFRNLIIIPSYLFTHRVIKILQSILTKAFSTRTLGRAEAYSKNRTLMPIPITIPSSKRMKRQDKNVANAGIRSSSEK